MPFLASEGCFWPLTASMTSEVKKNHAHVYPYRNVRKFSEMNWFDRESHCQSVRTSFDY